MKQHSGFRSVQKVIADSEEPAVQGAIPAAPTRKAAPAAKTSTPMPGMPAAKKASRNPFAGKKRK